MTTAQITTSLFSAFAHKPTTCQARALYLLEEFLDSPSIHKVFMLSGAAGTGKTTLMQALVSYLAGTNFHVELLAPTGKAAKVLTHRSKSMATTIHHLLYQPIELKDGRIFYNYKPNLSRIRTIYVVDEASMLSASQANDGLFFAENAPLIDLLRHAKEGHPDNQVIFVGDTYQLEPIGETESVALSAEAFAKLTGLSVQQTTLQEVMRQAADSPIISLANRIKQLKDNGLAMKEYVLKFPRLRDEQEALHYFLTYFDANQPENVIYLACSNAKVQQFNRVVRQHLGLTTQTLTKGDLVCIDETWQNAEHKVIRGDMGVVQAVSTKVEERADLKFVEAEIAFRDAKDKLFTVQTKVLMDYLIAEKPMLQAEQMKHLKADRMSKNNTYRSSQRATDDPYMNAMHLRYGYALTTHKAQGSEWERVLIDPKFHLGNGHRWLYTAVTRAKLEVWSWRY